VQGAMAATIRKQSLMVRLTCTNFFSSSSTWSFLQQTIHHEKNYNLPIAKLYDVGSLYKQVSFSQPRFFLYL